VVGNFPGGARVALAISGHRDGRPCSSSRSGRGWPWSSRVRWDCG